MNESRTNVTRTMGDWTLLEMQERDEFVGRAGVCATCGAHLGVLDKEVACASCGVSACEECAFWVPVIVHQEERVRFVRSEESRLCIIKVGLR